MHELSVATALVAQAERAAARAGGGRVVAVRVRLGRLSGLVPESLTYGFALAAEGTPLAGARLDLERVDPVVWCAPCQAAVTLASTTRFRCPDCDTPSADILAGRELELRSLELEDAVPDDAVPEDAVPDDAVPDGVPLGSGAAVGSTA